MKEYPTIPKTYNGDLTCFWVFDKIDGSQIRVEWTDKRGFCKYGSRKRLLGDDQGVLAKAKLLAEAQEHKFREVFKLNKFDKVVCFFEFWGPNSFAGSHLANDEHRLTLLDIDVYKHGMLSPNKFLEIFEPTQVEIPKFLHYGAVDEDFRNLVRKGQLAGVTYEGVVCKAYSKRKRTVEMFKIKSEAWIVAVKAKFADNPKLLEQIL